MKLKFIITASLIVMALNNTVEAQTKTKTIKQDQTLSKPTQSIQIIRDELAYQTTQINTLQTIKFSPRFLTETVGGELLNKIECKPEYPKASLRNEEMGSTHVQFTLSKQGEIIQLELLQTSGFKNLDRAVINTLEKCRFRPLSINQQAIKEQFSIVYTWRLD